MVTYTYKDLVNYKLESSTKGNITAENLLMLIPNSDVEEKA